MLWYGDPRLSLCLMSDLLTTDLIRYNGSNISVNWDMNITSFLDLLLLIFLMLRML